MCFKVDTRMNDIQRSTFNVLVIDQDACLVIDGDACAAFWKQT